ncbi:4-hydroxybenzoate octaprenyltransferase [Aliikangiella coralliicola]|uniref:4-hydroxybenzoate octaprenyltransferase n=2 Tax=Aliikangiella coralliicola TaxID=2592383 RepID=A0A545U820_9GAMM|nr:4-hydroxybenzoate octaprenyltransferase [Aliikangiella coralliicola]
MLRDFWQVLAKLKPSPYWQKRFIQYSLLMRVDRPIGTLLLLWPTLWALWLASDGVPSLSLIVIFSVGVFLTRSAGCVINDYADRNFDGKVERTKTRPLATGLVSEKEALILFTVLSLFAFSLVLLLNAYSIFLSIIAIVIATIYPFMKRITYFPQVVLGAAFSMSIPMAFAATNNEVTQSAWLLYVANLLWVLAYDTLYGMVDKKDDLKVGIKSTAILFGEADLQIIAIIQGFFLFGMILVGAKFELNFWYYLSVIGAAGFIAWQLYICKKREREKCFIAFLNNNWVGACIFCGILLSKSF